MITKKTKIFHLPFYLGIKGITKHTNRKIAQEIIAIFFKDVSIDFFDQYSFLPQNQASHTQSQDFGFISKTEPEKTQPDKIKTITRKIYIWVKFL